jgi:hypothetical protein
MKKLILLLMVFVLLGCSNPATGEKETVIKENSNSNIVSAYTYLNKIVYPLSKSLTMKEKLLNGVKKLNFGELAYAGNGNGYVSVGAAKKANDLVAGVFYFDNSINSDDVLYHNVWRTLDLSNKIGKKVCHITMYIRVIAAGAGGLDEYAIVKFRSPDAILEPKTCSQKYGDTIFRAVEVISDTDGCIQWTYAGNNAQNKKTEMAEPDYNDIEELTLEIVIYDSFETNK